MSDDEGNKKDWKFEVESLDEEQAKPKEELKERIRQKSKSEPSLQLERNKKPVDKSRNNQRKSVHRVYSTGDIPVNEFTFDQCNPAPLDKRIMALIIDGLVVVGLSLILKFTFKMALLKFYPEGESGFYSLSKILDLILAYLVFVRPLQTKSASLGKRYFHLEVVTKEGPYLSFFQSFIRELLVKVIFIILFPITILSCLLSKKRRGIHDLISGTMVVDTQ